MSPELTNVDILDYTLTNHINFEVRIEHCKQAKKGYLVRNNVYPSLPESAIDDLSHAKTQYAKRGNINDMYIFSLGSYDILQDTPG